MILDFLKNNSVDKKEEEVVESILDEETAAQRFAKEAEPENLNGDSITDILDDCAKKANSFYRILAAKAKRGIITATAKETNKFNPLFVGPTGVGKTSIISTWARDRGYELITLNMMGDALDFLGVKTINRDYDLKLDDEGNTKKVARVSTVATQAFDPFLTGKTKILFLDELNKTNPRILQALYDLISFHTVQNGDELMYLPKLLFTVGAMNPSTYGGGRDQLDPALKARMQIVYVNYDTKGLKEYMLKELNQDIEVIEAEIKDIKDNGGSEEDAKDWLDDYKIALGKKDLLEKVFESPKKFIWTDPQSIADADELEPVLVPRTFEMALSNCDGTKADFLKKVLKLCGPDAAELINELLANYKDKDHKANLIWGKDYSVKDDEEESSAEDEIVGTEEEEEEAELNTNLLKRLQKIRSNLDL